MTIKVLNDVALIASGITKAQYDAVKKHKPEALKLINSETKTEEYVVLFADDANSGSINEHGAVFDTTTDDGKLALTINIHRLGNTASKRAKRFAEDMGFAIYKLTAIEEQIRNATESIQTVVDSVKDSIVVYAE